MSTTIEPATDFKVADLSLAPWGRKEIELAEVEMPGLMALRAEHAEQKEAGQAAVRDRIGAPRAVGAVQPADVAAQFRVEERLPRSPPHADRRVAQPLRPLLIAE